MKKRMCTKKDYIKRRKREKESQKKENQPIEKKPKYAKYGAVPEKQKGAATK